MTSSFLTQLIKKYGELNGLSTAERNENYKYLFPKTRNM